MFYEQRTAVPDTPEALRAEYEADLGRLVSAVGVEAATATTGIDEERLAALEAGTSPALTLEEAARTAALADDAPDSETIETVACEHLLLGMTTAVLDVDAVERELPLDLDAREIQQRIERRAPMSFEEFTHLQYVIIDAMA